MLVQSKKLFDTAHAVMTFKLVDQNLRQDARELFAAQVSCHVVEATPIRLLEEQLLFLQRRSQHRSGLCGKIMMIESVRDSSKRILVSYRLETSEMSLFRLSGAHRSVFLADLKKLTMGPHLTQPEF